MIFFRVVLFHPSTTLRFGRYNLFIYRMALLWLNLYTVISNQIKQWSHIEKFEFLGLFREWLSFTWRNLLVSYHFSVIAMETRSYRNTGKQYIFYWDILTIAVVIWIPKNTSIYLAFVFTFHFVERCIVSCGEQYVQVYCHPKIAWNTVMMSFQQHSAVVGWILFFNEASKTIGYLFFHLQTHFSFLFDEFLSLISSSISSLLAFPICSISLSFSA